MKCRHCLSQADDIFVDLGTSPPSNAYLEAAQLAATERYYPLRVLVCKQCWLVQTEDYAGADELFNENYAYFSSYSTSWLDHSQRYVKEMAQRFKLGKSSTVVEVAANDGYLLQYFKHREIPCYGIEPTASTAAAARKKGLEIFECFFGLKTASSFATAGRQADLMIGNNVLAHVPDINDFVSGFTCLLKPGGVATFEFPHLLQMVDKCQFDTIYHEHFSYLSLSSVCAVFERTGLNVFDVAELPTHGGSLRVFAQRQLTGQRPRDANVDRLLKVEAAAGIQDINFYRGFQAKANRVKDDFLSYLIEAKRSGLMVAGYGAAAKGNTLLNYAGVRHDLMSFVVDRNPSKQGKYLPGSRIPIVAEDEIKIRRPDRIVILPWNLADEIMLQLAYIREWRGRIVCAVPHIQDLG